MNDNVYGVTEIVGSSDSNVDDAVRNAIRTASKTVRNLEWFEVSEIRGHIVDDDIGHFQVMVKLGFRYEK